MTNTREEKCSLFFYSRISDLAYNRHVIAVITSSPPPSLGLICGSRRFLRAEDAVSPPGFYSEPAGLLARFRHAGMVFRWFIIRGRTSLPPPSSGHPSILMSPREISRGYSLLSSAQIPLSSMERAFYRSWRVRCTGAAAAATRVPRWVIHTEWLGSL